jgi:hypothetical protein
MAREVLERCLEQIAAERSDFERVIVLMYGRGDSLLHPDLGQVLLLCRERLPDVVITMSVEVSSAIPRDTTFIEALDAFHVVHKPPQPGWSMRALEWTSACPKVIHQFYLREVTAALIAECGKELGNIHVAGLHDIPFQDNLRKDDLEAPLFTVEEGVDVQLIPKPDTQFIRAAFTVDGKLRGCLVTPSKHKTLREHITGERVCEYCWCRMQRGVIINKVLYLNQ